MYFSFIERDWKFNGELLYIHDEYSLCYIPFSTNVSVSILCGGYTSLDTICETGSIVHISGLNSNHIWIPAKLEMPKSKRGELIAHFDKPPLKGTGVDYDRSWRTYYDKNSHCICIGNPSVKDSDFCIEFANEIVAVLNGERLIAIWAKIREVQML